MAEKVSACTRCANTGWVCEDHADRAWKDCDCGGAGMPCLSCNKNTGPEDPPDASRLGFVPAASERVGGVTPDGEAERYMHCPKRGQVYDARDPDAGLAHDGPLPHRIEIQ
jgi:hypothetical protein